MNKSFASREGRRRGPHCEAVQEVAGVRCLRTDQNPSPSHAFGAGPSLSLRERVQ
jgi:hypothetical protein